MLSLLHYNILGAQNFYQKLFCSTEGQHLKKDIRRCSLSSCEELSLHKSGLSIVFLNYLPCRLSAQDKRIRLRIIHSGAVLHAHSFLNLNNLNQEYQESIIQYYIILFSYCSHHYKRHIIFAIIPTELFPDQNYLLSCFFSKLSKQRSICHCQKLQLLLCVSDRKMDTIKM